MEAKAKRRNRIYVTLKELNGSKIVVEFEIKCKKCVGEELESGVTSVDLSATPSRNVWV